MRIVRLVALAGCIVTMVACEEDDWEKSMWVNVNANSCEDGSAGRLEMLHVDGGLFYAPHYVAYEGREVMNMAVEWNPLLRHSAWVAFFWDASTSRDSVVRGSKWKTGSSYS